MQKSNVQQKDDLKDELKVEFTVEFKEKVELKDDLNSFNFRPSSKKTTFCQFFPFKDLEFSKLFHIFALRKDIRQAHSFTHIRVLFETMRYL